MGFLGEVVYQSVSVVAENTAECATNHLAAAADQFVKSLKFSFQMYPVDTNILVFQTDVLSCFLVIPVLNCF